MLNTSSGRITLPGTDSLKPDNFAFYPDFNVVAPANQALPKQEPGVRPARALPYSLHAHGKIEASGRSFVIDFQNTGRAAAVFQVRSGSDAHIPRTYTVEPNKSLSDTWNLGAIGVADCDLSVYGPNGFFRAFKGSVSALRTAQLDLQTDYDEILGDITLVITNLSTQSAKVSILDKYRDRSVDLRERQHKRPCDRSVPSYAHRSGVIGTDSVTPF